MNEREAYNKPAEPVLVGSVEMSASSYAGSGADLSIYDSGA